MTTTSSREIKLEWRDGATLRKRWLDRPPSALGTDGDQLTLREGSREVRIRTDHPRTPPGHYAVTADFGASTHWADAGADFAAALALAEDVLARGAAAFEATS